MLSKSIEMVSMLNAAELGELLPRIVGRVFYQKKSISNGPLFGIGHESN
jgi:hypothetical protein